MQIGARWLLLFQIGVDKLVDINKKFENLVDAENRKSVARLRSQKQREKYARLVESFMNIHQIENTGLCNDFVESYYAKQRQELGDNAVDALKRTAAEYVNILKSNGDIYSRISWFRFALSRLGR